MCMVYMTQALDKGALGPVSIMGWQEDVGAKGQDFAMTSTVMWIGIIAGEPLVGRSHSMSDRGTKTAGKSTCQTIPYRQDPRCVDVHLDSCMSYSVFYIQGVDLTFQLLFGLAFTFTIPPILGNRVRDPISLWFSS